MLRTSIEPEVGDANDIGPSRGFFPDQLREFVRVELGRFIAQGPVPFDHFRNGQRVGDLAGQAITCRHREGPGAEQPNPSADLVSANALQLGALTRGVL